MIIVKKPIDVGDQRVAEGVVRALQCSPYLALRMLSCSVTQRIVTLQGRLPSFYLKQVAQSLACRVEGAVEVRSEIEVTD